ncbi:LysR family transcriptional regulator [Aquabacterium soli]|uniref:LysR family transcriptional regulator n=1 Tax=Aquabacterium soli TaxID=2493092 RepID=A0A426VG14_9BURK|nr:LysR family transcriptional regulator [Aquabacterium soli]
MPPKLPPAPLSASASAAPDRIALMQTFVHIVEAGSLSAAAQQMGATQPTVSRRLQALERSLGLRLLRRSTHAMQLTEDGERCYTRAKELLENWASFEADLRGAGDAPEGRLRVVAPHALGQDLLVGPMVDYLQAFPGVTVDWLLHDRRPDFITEDIDCAIQVGEVTDPSVVAIKLSEVPRIVVAAPSVIGQTIPAHPSELAALPWLALRTFYRTEILLTPALGGEPYRLPIRPRMGTDSLYALRTAALAGLGACAASTWLLRDDLSEGRLVQLVPDWLPAPLPVYLVYPHARFYPAKLRRFIEAMKVAVPISVGSL